jgi:hypothetical protein
MAHHCRGDFVIADRTELLDLGDGFQQIEGNIRCRGALYISVDKRLRCWVDKDGVRLTQAVHYGYNCIVGRLGAVYRYNSPHDHRPFYHVHEYDALGAEKGPGTIVEVPLEDWPNLSQVILRFRDWYYSNLETLTARQLA